MSESSILGWLKIDDYLKVAIACETSPKSASEIARITNLSETRCAEVLKNLEDVHAVEYTGTGWKLADIGKRVIDKYFK